MSTFRPFRFNRRIYRWRKSASAWQLLTEDRVVARVVPDAAYPNTWRVEQADGRLSA